jgi:glycosyltransferase involved in cell wall biosynthesis
MTCGGVQMRTLELHRRLDRARLRFDFCALSGLAAELDEHARALGGRVHHLAQSRPGFARRFCELLVRRQYDVVHGHLHYLSGYPLKLARECGVAVRVAHFRSSRPDPIPGVRRRLVRVLLRPWIEQYAGNRVQRRWIERHATHVLGVSRWALTCAMGPKWTSDPRCREIYDGLDPTAFRDPMDRQGVRGEFAVPGDAPLLIHVGRMTPAKNHARLVSIFAELARRLPGARLLLVGREDEAIGRRVRRQIAARRIADGVVFAGERLDVPRLVRAADALIFPSLWEGLGDVVLEAAAAGTPAVCSDLPSIREIAEHLPGIERLSLAEPDAHWADRLVGAAANPPDEATRRAALARFSASVFHVDRSAAALCAIWGAPEASPPRYSYLQTEGAGDG